MVFSCSFRMFFLPIRKLHQICTMCFSSFSKIKSRTHFLKQAMFLGHLQDVTAKIDEKESISLTPQTTKPNHHERGLCQVYVSMGRSFGRIYIHESMVFDHERSRFPVKKIIKHPLKQPNESPFQYFFVARGSVFFLFPRCAIDLRLPWPSFVL